jgi:cytochrome c peroxidase
MTRILFGPLLVLVFVSSAVVLSSSQLARKNTLNLPAAPDRHANVELPAYFAEPGHNHDNTPSDNPLTDDGATLGRVLFYDTRLSANNTTWCKFGEGG